MESIRDRDAGAGASGGLARLAERLDALNEFDREPVPPHELRGGRYFAAIYGGEHVAGTEFVIGSLFVLGGVSARDLILGLIVGNTLAVLSWTFICAPIATRVRLTLYWYLRKIAGPGLCVLYCLANALLFCFLAGAMIALCADAVSNVLERLGLEFSHPSLADRYPSNAGWVALVLLCGAVVTTLAILGFEKMAKFASVCVPWMFLIFVAAALSVLARPEMGLRGIGDLSRVASEKIWTGQPVPGQPHLGFWHVASFAWFCNLCTHVDLSDMAIFRYARHWRYGLYSAIGMFLGHFLAWLCSGVICAPFRDLIIATGNRDPSLSVANLAYGAAGISGVLCVLFASWSTANPTLYRAGLAFQIATPNWPRWKVTLAAGAVTSVAACFPVFVMQLLDFVAIFGLVLMPVGAVVFAEHWIVPRVGLAQYWSERRGLFANPAALVTWIATLAFCLLFLRGALGVHVFFLWLPGYLLALLLYPLLAAVSGARIPGVRAEPVRRSCELAPALAASDPTPDADRALPAYRLVAAAAALASLAAILGSSIARVSGALGASAFQTIVDVSTVVWFASAPVWLTPGLFGLEGRSRPRAVATLLAIAGLLLGAPETRALAAEEVSFLGVVRRYADSMLERGRDVYGPVQSGLFLSALDRHTLGLLEVRPAPPGGIRREDRAGLPWRELTGANPQLDENLLRVLYALSDLTGERRYAEAADHEIRWFFGNAQSPATGLLAWGEHLAWDAVLDRPVSSSTDLIHEFARPWALWERTFALAPEAARRFALGLWEHQIADRNTGAYDRHAPYDRHGPVDGKDFPRHGAFYIQTWAHAYRATGERVFLQAIETVLARFERKRSASGSAEPTLGPLEPEEAAALVPEPLAARLRSFAEEEDRRILALLRREHAKPDGSWAFRPTWQAAYASGIVADWAMLALERYEQTKKPEYRDVVVAIADAYAGALPDEDADVWPMSLAHVISAEIAAYRFTGRSQYLEEAIRFARLAVEVFWQDRPLPRASFKTGHYESITGADSLALALLEVHVAASGLEAKVPSNTIDR